jgi:serine/threonine-protein kinase
VALKVIHHHLAGDPQIRGRFTREAAILRRLEGDRVCPVLEFGEIPDPGRDGVGLLYMVLARIDGPALDTLLKRERLLPIARALRILLDVCDALREAHAQGVIHRDLKPGNVLLRGDETSAQAVVVDFGMAKIMTGGGTGTTALTQHNMVFGTPEYMAPEQARGDELDARCDVYAAGIILYELLVGAVPFSGPTPLNVLTAQMTEAPVRPRARAPERGISGALEAVVLHAIAKDPAERYPTAGALAAGINAAIAAPDDVDAVRPTTRVHVRIDTTDAHGVTLPSPVRLTKASARPPPVSSVRRSVPAASSSPWWIVVCVVAALAGIAVGAWLSLHAGK